jgi:hypothetical protein
MNCPYCNGAHPDDPCPVRASDAQRFVDGGKRIYGRPTGKWCRWCGVDSHNEEEHPAMLSAIRRGEVQAEITLTFAPEK